MERSARRKRSWKWSSWSRRSSWFCKRCVLVSRLFTRLRSWLTRRCTRCRCSSSRLAGNQGHRFLAGWTRGILGKRSHQLGSKLGSGSCRNSWCTPSRHNSLWLLRSISERKTDHSGSVGRMSPIDNWWPLKLASPGKLGTRQTRQLSFGKNHLDWQQSSPSLLAHSSPSVCTLQ